ncbi:sensor histidine kinase [Paenibacillus antibioticophila]|uniref:sensor histidine kinase n=1 Tax=Paenibacillus antibioticophila TaxID=1274374 RepID=UPI0005CB53FA|nr:histidine kinase [Paenibacillus antibioticophila]
MIRLIKGVLNDLKFRDKLLLSHLIIALIPILLLGILSFSQSYNIQMKEMNSEATSSLEQTVNILDYKINRYNMLSEFIVLNREFSRIFLKNYEDNYFNIYLDFRDVLDPLISQIKFMDSDIEEVEFYTSGDLLGIRGDIHPLSDLQNKPWFDQNDSTRWIVYDKQVYLLQQLIGNRKTSSYMVISISYDSIFSSLEGVSDHIAVSIRDDQQELIFPETSDQLMRSERTTELQKSLNNNDWTLNFSVSHANAYKNALTFFQITFFVILLSLLITFSLIYIFSSSFTRRIVHLKNKVDKVEQNNLGIIIQSHSRDEFGELTNGIGKMLQRINDLISRVYQAEISKKESEYNQLIAQINPHFLYNTLSFINWRAVKKQDIETGYMVNALAKFYRTALNKGKKQVTIQDELENIKAYIDLQLILHDGSFEVDYQIDNELLEYRIIHFILQPIVENAIKHGFAEPGEDEHQLVISVHAEHDALFLKVTDNGMGMSVTQQQRLLLAESSGYGIRNVNERIKLYYGSAYGLELISEAMVGTSVIIRLPYDAEYRSV